MCAAKCRDWIRRALKKWLGKRNRAARFPMSYATTSRFACKPTWKAKCCRGKTMNTAQVLVELLKEYRVEHIFGVPGDTTMVLYDALYAARGEITHIMARDERSAAFMADAYAPLSHRPALTPPPTRRAPPYSIPALLS